MENSVARHLRTYLGAGFWLSALAATMNGVYWRIGAPPVWQRGLALSTALVAVVALMLNARDLRSGAVSGGRLGRRITWLLQVTLVGVILTVGWFLMYGAA